MKILITSGATREPIDGVRFITNFASGKTGCVLAEFMAKKSHDVVYLHGVGAKKPAESVRTCEFVTFADLELKLQNFLRAEDFDAVVHLAAVGDFSLSKIELEDGSFLDKNLAGKLDSAQNIKLHLQRNHKILPQIKSFAKKGSSPFVVGFKLTNFADDAEIEKKMEKIFAAGGVDLVVQNDKSKIQGEFHPAVIYRSCQNIVAKAQSKQDLAAKLLEILEGEKSR